MGFTKEGWFGLIIEICVPILFVVCYFAGVITNVTSDIEITVLAVLAVMIPTGVGLMYKGRKTKPKTLSKPNFSHVKAYFFYPQQIDIANANEPTRDMSKLKAIVITDSRKAYFVFDRGVIKLVQSGKIEPLLEAEQDVNKWCEKNKYTSVLERCTEEDLLEPYFEAEIKDKKSEYHRGDRVLFRTHFQGELTHGFFNNRIMHSENKNFHRGRYFNHKKNRAYSWSSDTLSSDSWWVCPAYLKGKLNGYVNFTSEWSYCIPFDAPLGEYRILMQVFNRVNRPPIVLRLKEDTISVVS